jgi:hypothetical protein
MGHGLVRLMRLIHCEQVSYNMLRLRATGMTSLSSFLFAVQNKDSTVPMEDYQ